MRKYWWLGVAAAFALGCSDSDSDSGGTGGAGGDSDAGLNADMGGGEGGAGGTGGDGGGGGEGGMRPMEPSIDDRCPDAQAGTFALVAFPDRVDAYRHRAQGIGYACEFLALRANGITNATGITRGVDGFFYVVQPEEGTGSIYKFSPNGEFVEKTLSNVNLQGISGIWNTFGDEFLVHSNLSQNMYRINANLQFRGGAMLPAWQGSQVENVTDVVYLDQDSVVMTFSDRPAKLFKLPFGPDWPTDVVGAGNAVAGVETEEGVKVLMSAQVGGLEAGYGVALFAAAESGRVTPDLEQWIIPEGEIEDGAAIVAHSTGLLVLDSGRGGTARLHDYNGIGDRQNSADLQGDGVPFDVMLEQVFPDF